MLLFSHQDLYARDYYAAGAGTLVLIRKSSKRNFSYFANFFFLIFFVNFCCHVRKQLLRWNRIWYFGCEIWGRAMQKILTLHSQKILIIVNIFLESNNDIGNSATNKLWNLRSNVETIWVNWYILYIDQKSVRNIMSHCSMKKISFSSGHCATNKL